MKKIIFSLILSSLFTLANADTGIVTPVATPAPSDAGWSELQIKKIDKVLRCTRDIVENSIGGYPGLQFSAKMIEAVSLDADFNVHAVCRKFIKSNNSLKTNTTDEVKHIRSNIHNIEAPQNIKEILNAFNEPTFSCEETAVQLNASLILGLGLGVGVGDCIGTNGKRFYIASPKGSFSGGIYIGLNIRKINYKSDGSLVEDSADKYEATGLGASLFKTSSGMKKYFSGGGFGIGFTDGIGKNLRIKVFPAMDDYSAIRENL